MNAKLQNLPEPWVDPDDAPELTDEWFDKAEWRIGDKVVGRKEAQAAMVRRGRGRPAGTAKKEHINLRVDIDVLEAYRATGEGWQTRMNEALRKGLESPGR